MDLEEFTEGCEKPIYSGLEELYDIADLNQEERAIFNKYRKRCEYWLLRSKRSFAERQSGHPNFIQNLARVLINLQSPKVTGAISRLVKEMFGDKKVHRCYKTKNGFRSTINSNKVFNTYFELKIMSFFLRNGFDIVISKSEVKGHKIPEFVAEKKTLRINVEAKQLNVDKVMDHIFGDVFIDGIDHRPTKIEREIGYEKIQSTVQLNYENALLKYFAIPANEYFILFLSAYYSIHHMGKATVDYLKELPREWKDEKFRNLVGVILPEQDNTLFIENENCDIDLAAHINDIATFHDFNPDILCTR